MRALTKEDIAQMLLVAEEEILNFEGRTLVPGDTPQITFYFHEYTGGEYYYPPQNIIDAALVVRDWIKERDLPEATKICGLKLTDD